MERKVDIYLQARMGSTRLPGKALIELTPGVTILDACVERLERISGRGRIVILTTSLPQDDVLGQYSLRHKFELYRGTPGGRILVDFYQASKQFQSTDVLRATGDNPFVDPIETTKLIELHFRSMADYTTNRSEVASGLPVGLPIGVGVEIFTAKALGEVYRLASTPAHWEHINDTIFDHKNLFHIEVLPPPPEKYAPEIALTIDTNDQLETTRKLVAELNKRKKSFDVAEAIKIISSGKLGQL